MNGMVEDLNDLLLFARVVEAGGFSAAERETGTPKSRLSRRVGALERQLGVRLIQRSAHRFQVTDVGERVYRHARSMADEAQAVRATVDETLGEPAGPVRISASPVSGELLLGGWLGEFSLRHPKVRITLDLSNRFVDLLGERIDLAIRYASQPLASADIVARPIGVGRMELVGAPALLAAHGEPTEPADLHRFPALGQGGGPDSVRPWALVDGDGRTLLHHPQPLLISDNYQALREAALRGAGLVQLPLEACRDALADGRLRRVLPAWPSLATQAYVLYPSRKGMSSAVRAVLALLETRYRELEPPGAG